MSFGMEVKIKFNFILIGKLRIWGQDFKSPVPLSTII
jgi:hypothetical protein